MKTLLVIVAAGASSLAASTAARADDARYASVRAAAPAVAPRAAPWFMQRDLALGRARRGASATAAMPSASDAWRGVVPLPDYGGEQRIEPATTGEGGVADQYGTALAFDGTTLVVTAMQDLLVRPESVFGARSGSATIYRMVADVPQFDGKIEPPDEQSNAIFGFSVDAEGDLVVVGAPRAVIGGAPDRGAAYVYERIVGNWQLVATLAAPDAALDQFFGWSVALDGTRIVVGAPRRDGVGAIDAGAAYVYDRVGGQWTLSASLTAADAAAGDRFGDAVAVAGDVVLVGATAHEHGATLDAGAVYGYARDGGGAWLPTGETGAPTPAVGARFGAALEFAADLAFVGAPGDTVGTASGQGAVYAYARSGAVLSAPTRIVASDGETAEAFGSDLAYHDGTLLVGAPLYRRVQGAAYVYTRAGAAFTQRATLTRPVVLLQNGMGAGVAVHGDTAWVGANLESVGANRAQGVAHRYDRAGETWPRVASLDTGDGAGEELFGNAAAIDGDTLVVGAFLEDPAINDDDAGMVSIYTRVDGTWARIAHFTAPDALAEDQFGFSVAVRGEWIAIGAPQSIIDDQFNRGAVYLYRRIGGTWTFQQKLVTSTGFVDDAFGYSLAFDETGTRLLVGVPGDNVGAEDNGSARLYGWQGDGWTLRQTIRPPRPIAGGVAALRVAISSRALALGAPDDDTLGINTGRVHVYGSTGADYTFAQTLETAARNTDEFFGNALAIDGVRLAIGAPGYVDDDFLVDRGIAYVIDDARASTSPLRAVLPPVPLTGQYFGVGIALRGDRLFVGASGEPLAGRPSVGAMHVFRVDDDAIVLAQTLRPANGLAWEFYGRPVDASDDALVVGAPGRGAVNPREGAVYAYRDLDRLFDDGFE